MVDAGFLGFRLIGLETVARNGNQMKRLLDFLPMESLGLFAAAPVLITSPPAIRPATSLERTGPPV
jgi:hypothetical protein